ncbi:MAG: ATP-binding protein, partial [Clostridia bacterium]|nr:ATP-binding protein [Clostridia bacterium]
NFMLVAAMNPCRCGHYGTGACKCSPSEVRKYRQRISGPIYDRIDIQKYLGKVDVMQKHDDSKRMRSADIRKQVLEARAIQERRFKDVPGVSTNAQMETMHIKRFCKLDSECETLMENTYAKYPFSARSYNKIMNLSRTFADIGGSDKIRKEDVISALMARDLDKEDAMRLGD